MCFSFEQVINHNSEEIWAMPCLRSALFTKCKDARREAKHLGLKVRCSLCHRPCEVKDLSFRQWSGTSWTALCIPCERGEWDGWVNYWLTENASTWIFEFHSKTSNHMCWRIVLLRRASAFKSNWAASFQDFNSIIHIFLVSYFASQLIWA